MIKFPFYGFPRNPFFPGFYYNSNFKKEKSITKPIYFGNTLSDSEQALFEFFGINLYLDDLIILGLLFFLYKEKVDDQFLYMILLLLQQVLFLIMVFLKSHLILILHHWI